MIRMESGDVESSDRGRDMNIIRSGGILVVSH